jgi:periplasmic protein CpxP/Spy
MSRAHLHAYRSQPGCPKRRAKVNEIDNPSIPPASQSQRRALRRRLVIGGAAALVLVAGTAAAARAWTVHHHWHGHGDWGAHPAMSADMVEKRLDFLLHIADGTPEQQARLHGIVEAAFKDLDPIHQHLADTRLQIMGLLAAPQIDRAAAEQLRSARMADIDQASKRLTQALLDAADVLTPQQRKKLADTAAEWRTLHRD